MTVSVVIPAWNDAEMLERLLRSLPQREFLEVIVVDNDSNDSTRDVATEFGCRIVNGGRPGKARNRGATAAAGTTLLFIDADVVPTARSLHDVRKFDRSDGQALRFRHRPLSRDWRIRIAYCFAELWFTLTGMVGVGQGLVSFLAVKRDYFAETGGFDEDIEPGEDVEFCRRAAIVASAPGPVWVSPRRLLEEGPVRFSAKTVLWCLLRLIGSRRSVIPYRWEGHPAQRLDVEGQLLGSKTCRVT